MAAQGATQKVKGMLDEDDPQRLSVLLERMHDEAAEAKRAQAEAEERAAQARQGHAAAERQAVEAERMTEDARAHHDQARAIDPDVSDSGQDEALAIDRRSN